MGRGVVLFNGGFTKSIFFQPLLNKKTMKVVKILIRTGEYEFFSEGSPFYGVAIYLNDRPDGKSDFMAMDADGEFRYVKK